MTYEIEPNDHDGEVTLIWSTDDDTIANVDDDGLVTGVGEGTTTITCMANGEEYTDEVVVNVKNPSDEG